MIIKNICKKIRISEWALLYLLIFLIAGLFKEMLIIMFLLIIHECGHLLTALIMKWEVNYIRIFPFGGNIYFNNILNKPLLEEFMVVLYGPLFQMIGYLFLINIFENIYIINIINQYHFSLLLFNLLPIYPLDGSKILGIVLYYFFPFSYALKIQNILSIIFIVIVGIIYYKNYSFLMILGYLLINNVNSLRRIKYTYQKFLLEKYLYKNIKAKKIIVNNISLFYRNKINIINNGRYKINENEYLSHRFAPIV